MHEPSRKRATWEPAMSDVIRLEYRNITMRFAQRAGTA